MLPKQQRTVADVMLYTPSDGTPCEKVQSGAYSLLCKVGLVFLPGNEACPAHCRVAAGLILLPSAAFVYGGPMQQYSSSSFSCRGFHASQPPRQRGDHSPVTVQTRYAQEKVLRGSWGLPRLYN